MNAEELYCKVYVDIEQDRSWLVETVATLCVGVAVGRTVESAELVVDVSRNEDYDPVRRKTQDGFVYFRYYLDVLPGETFERDVYVTAVGRLLLGLWARGIKAVAACDFEAELPTYPQ